MLIFMSTESNFLYSVEREYPVAVDIVWDAWMDAVKLEAWYHPTMLRNVEGSAVSEPEVGGWWTIAVDVPEAGFQSYFWGKYTILEPNKLIEHSMFYSQDPAKFTERDITGDSARITVDFEDRDGSTWVRFSQFGVLPKEHIPLAKAGMDSYFESLANFLAV